MDPWHCPGRIGPIGMSPGGLDFRSATRQSLTQNGRIFHVQLRLLWLPIAEMDGFLSAMWCVRPAHRKQRPDPFFEAANGNLRFHP